MSLDLAVLRAIKRKEQFDKVEKFISNGTMDDNTKVMVTCFRTYYQMHPSDVMIDMDIFRHLFFHRWYPRLTKETQEVYSILIDRICDDITLEQQASIVNALIENELATNVANDIEEFQNEGEFDIIERVMARSQEAKKLQEVVATASYATVQTLTEKPESSVCFKWPLPTLAQTCRPMSGSDNIAIVALTDVGKTGLTLQFAVSMARQTHKPIIWFNNEGARERIQYRAYAMMLGQKVSVVKQLLDAGTLGAYLEQAMGRPDPVRIYDVHGMNTDQLQELIKRTHEEEGVGAVIWDMLSNVALKNAASFSRDDKVIEAKYQYTRELGTIYDFPNIITCQQSHDKEWRQWPTKDCMKDTKIGAQGALDMILYMTQPEEASKETTRYICAPKNKLALEGAPTLRLECKYDKSFGVYE